MIDGSCTPPTLRACVPAIASDALSAARAHDIVGLAGNLISNAPALASCIAQSPSEHLVCWSGWVVDDDDPATPSPRTWGSAGWAALRRFCEAAAQDASSYACVPAARPRSIAFWTHAGTVLSDVPSSLRFLAEVQGWTDPACLRWSLVVDPIGMLAPSMMATAEDHVERIVRTLGTLPGVAVMIASTCCSAPFDCPHSRPIHATKSLLPLSLSVPANFRHRLEAHLAPHVAIALSTSDSASLHVPG